MWMGGRRGGTRFAEEGVKGFEGDAVVRDGDGPGVGEVDVELGGGEELESVEGGGGQFVGLACSIK